MVSEESLVIPNPISGIQHLGAGVIPRLRLGYCGQAAPGIFDPYPAVLAFDVEFPSAQSRLALCHL
jgi:hypothetical protein